MYLLIFQGLCDVDKGAPYMYVVLTAANHVENLTMYNIFYYVLFSIFCFIYLFLDTSLWKKDFVTHTLKSLSPLPCLLTATLEYLES